VAAVLTLVGCSKDPCKHYALIANTPSLSGVILNISSQCPFEIELEDTVNARECKVAFDAAVEPRALRIVVSTSQVALIDEGGSQPVVSLVTDEHCFTAVEPRVVAELVDSTTVVWRVALVECGVESGFVNLIVSFPSELPN
jgi:hypothetical protein